MPDAVEAMIPHNTMPLRDFLGCYQKANFNPYWSFHHWTDYFLSWNFQKWEVSGRIKHLWGLSRVLLRPRRNFLTLLASLTLAKRSYTCHRSSITDQYWDISTQVFRMFCILLSRNWFTVLVNYHHDSNPLNSAHTSLQISNIFNPFEATFGDGSNSSLYILTSRSLFPHWLPTL